MSAAPQFVVSRLHSFGGSHTAFQVTATLDDGTKWSLIVELRDAGWTVRDAIDRVSTRGLKRAMHLFAVESRHQNSQPVGFQQVMTDTILPEFEVQIDSLCDVIMGLMREGAQR